MLATRLRVNPAQRRRLIEASAGREPPDLVLRGGRVADVYTREVRPQTVAVAGGRIAYVGEEDRRADVEYELDGAVLVPGLIEPHGHADVVHTPAALVSHVVRSGTTTLSLEANELMRALSDEELVRMIRAMQHATARCLWRVSNGIERHGERSGAHAGPSTAGEDARSLRLLALAPDLVAVGEMVDWPQLLAGEAEPAGLMESALARGLRTDAHLAGASLSTLTQAAAAGLLSDHEAIGPSQVHDRLRLGYWVMLRSSSLRRDAGALAAELVASSRPLERVMLTTDGPVAEALLAGHLDAVIREIIAAGVPPLDALRMATIAPATYFGLDGHVGGIAPGRCADFLVVDSMENFAPQAVFVDGQRAEPGNISGGSYEWNRVPAPPSRSAPLTCELLRSVCLAGPALTVSGVITRPCERGENDALVALVARDGSWITGATLHDMAIEALASTHNRGQNVLLIGRDADRLIELYQRVLALGGGIATPAGEVPLPVGGYMFDGTVNDLAARIRSLAQSLPRGHDLPPVEFLTMFMATPALPELRLTPDGVVDVKRGVITTPSLSLA